MNATVKRHNAARMTRGTIHIIVNSICCAKVNKKLVDELAEQKATEDDIEKSEAGSDTSS